MKIFRIFENQLFTLLDTIELAGDIGHRICSVLRLEKDDIILLFNGDGYEYKSVITNVKRHTVFVKILEKIKKNLESSLKIHLGQVISKGDKMDFVIQKATELGIQKLTPLFSEHCMVQLKSDRIEKKKEHWIKIAIHAAEQCGRTEVPIIETPQTLVQWVQTRNEETRLVLSPLATQSLAATKIRGSVALLIGPEGGLSDDEVKIACKHTFTDVKLGPRVLRTETAALAAVTVVQCMAGDFSEHPLSVP